MRYILLNIILVFSIFSVSAQTTLEYYLPDSTNYNPAIPTPASVIGHEVGEWHVTHDKLVYYMQALAASSDRVQIIETGKTYENRPQLLLTITHPDNQNNIEQIRVEHKKLTDPSQSAKLDVSTMPAVAWMGFSIHGNEASGSNASMLTAYYLAAAEGSDIEDKLKNTVVLLDPSFNPDGLNRFASWVNMHKSENPVTDPNDREFNEVWPGGRTNHYWFDMNRDWLPGQLVESQNRIKQFHAWKPNILTDHHEMGTNSTFFFQPGIPSRTHPITPQKNQELTAEIGQFHAKYLDRIGSLYYTKESFDDFYYGKGSTFPDVQGAIGILFEQASSRGHAQESVNGVLKFPFTIKNQFTTTLSTFQAAYEMREELLNYQRDFYKTALDQSEKNTLKAWVVTDKDQSKLNEFAKMLQRHEIKIHSLAKNIDGYAKDNSLIIPTNQYQSRLIQAIFEKRTSFTDSLFYDVSAWTFPLSFNLEYKSLDSRDFNTNLLGSELSAIKMKGEVIGGKSDYAYLMEGHDYYAPKVLYKLQNAGLITKVSTKPLTIGIGESFPVGTIMILVKQQNQSSEEIYSLLQNSVKASGVKIYAMKTGNTKGVSLGSPSFDNLEKPKIAMLVGEGISPYDAGEMWHLMDQRYEIPLTKIDINDFRRTDISKYNIIILPDGRGYGNLADQKSKIQSWIKAGGVIIAYKNTTKWLAEQGITNVKFKKNKSDSIGYEAYADLGHNRGAQVIGGAIFEANVDLTHPLAYGLQKNQMPVFRNSTIYMEKSKNLYANPLRYTKKPLMSGYISDENSEELSETAVVTVSGVGRGRVISFVDNTNFRAFWYGTNKLLMNAVFFGQTISSRAAE